MVNNMLAAMQFSSNYTGVLVVSIFSGILGNCFKIKHS